MSEPAAGGGALHLSVVTPEGSLYKGEASFVAVPAYDGELGIMPKHTALIARLGTGGLRIVRDMLEGRRTDHYGIRGGFVQVLADDVTLLVTQAVKPEALKAEALAAEREELLEKLQHPPSDETYEELLEQRRWLETREALLAD